MTDQAFRLEPAAARKQAEVTFGERIEALIHRAGVRVVDIERGLAMPDSKIYRYFRGAENFRAAWLELLPAAVEILYLRERAAHHSFELAPVGNADDGTMSAVVSETADVQRHAVIAEADGYHGVEEAERELVEVREAKRALADREAHLLRVIAARGMRVMQGGAR